MNVLIVEDEVMAQKSLARVLTRNFPDFNIVGYTDSVKGTIEWLDDPANKADIIFMDVELSDGVCFEIFRQTDIKAKVIMTTAYDSYALKAFEAGSVDYLLKPIDPEALKRAVSRCRTRDEHIDVEALIRAAGGVPEARKDYKERFLIKVNDRIIPLETRKIAYIYSEEKSNWLVTSDGHKYIIDSSLNIVNEELDPDKFFMISRSCIISLKAITSIIKQAGGRLRIIPSPSSSFEMTVSRSRVDDFLAWLER
jgi:DNA-binding LytR/AlgR family response regulator